MSSFVTELLRKPPKRSEENRPTGLQLGDRRRDGDRREAAADDDRDPTEEDPDGR